MSAQSSVLSLPDLSRFCRTVPVELPSLHLNQKRELPQVPAVYLVVGEHDEVLYIGQSGNLSQRWVRHHRVSELQKLGNVRLVWIELETCRFLEEVEQVLIGHFPPRLNGFCDRSDPGRLKYVGVRLSLSQREFLDEAAEADQRTLSDFVRLAALKYAEELLGRPEKPGKPKKRAD